MNLGSNDIDRSAELELATLSPPPPYSPTEGLGGLHSDVKSIVSAINSPIRDGGDDGLRSAAAIDQTFRQSRALSRLGMNDTVFSKMNQLEGLVNSLQTALNSQTLAIHDVHDQLTDINDVLYEMQSKDKPSLGPNIEAVTTTAITESETLPITDDTTAINNNVIEPEQLVKDLRIAAATFAVKPSGVSSNPRAAKISQPENGSIRDGELDGGDGGDDDDDDDDTFEDAEDDSNYLRLCSMLEQLITDGNTAVENLPTTPEQLALDTQISDAETLDETLLPKVENEDIIPLPSTTTPKTDKDTMAYRRQRARETRSRCDAKIHPIDVNSLEYSSTVSADEGAWMEEESSSHEEMILQSTRQEEPEMEDIVGLVTDSNESDAIDVRFYCQVTRTGQSLQRHEIRRRMVLPLISGANLNPLNMRGLLNGTITSNTDNAKNNSTSSKESTATATLKQSRIGVVRRAIGTVQLMYWLLLFTLGALMLDSYLCKLAGEQAVQVVNSLHVDEKQSKKSTVRKNGKSRRSKSTSSATESRRRSF